MILALDTTTPQAGVALCEKGVVLAVRRARVTTHSEDLLRLVDEVFQAAGCKLGQVQAIACAAGPGSFTGLRIGMATAKGLCFALGKPLITVSSLQAMALRAPPGVVAVACLDAYKGEVFAGIYRAAFPPVSLGEERVLAPGKLAQELACLAESETVVLIGDGPVRWPELCVAGIVASDHAPPDPVDVARLAEWRCERGEADDLESSSPHYLRASEAELAAARKISNDASA